MMVNWKHDIQTATLFRKFHNTYYVIGFCSRKIKMSCFCKVRMSHSPHFRMWEFADGMDFKMFDMDQRVSHTAIVENKRLGEVLAFIKEQQERMAPPKVKTNSQKHGYQPNGRKPGRRIDIINDPAIIARRKKALARMEAVD